MKFKEGDVVICINNEECDLFLTLYHKYRVIENRGDCIIIRDDLGDDTSFFSNRFTNRKEKIINLLKDI